MTGPVASVIVALIVTLGALFGAGALVPDKHTYATVNFDGGYQKIGVISREEIFAEATVLLNGEELRSGSIDEIEAWIRKSGASDGTSIEKVTLKEGIVIKGRAGIRWTGSESNFKMTSESLELKSTSGALLKPLEVFDALNKMKDKAKAGRADTVKTSLVFSKAPTESFLLSKILAAVGK